MHRFRPKFREAIPIVEVHSTEKSATSTVRRRAAIRQHEGELLGAGEAHRQTMSYKRADFLGARLTWFAAGRFVTLAPEQMSSGLAVSIQLQAENGYQFADGCGRLIERGLFFRRQLDLDDLLDAFRAELYGNADEKPLDAVFAFEINGAGQDLLLVLENRFDHLNRRRGRRVIGRSRFQQIDDFGAALARAGDDRFELVLRQINSGRGMPATVEYRARGTMSSPWPPRTNECTFSTETFNSAATKVLMRAESSTPAMPSTRFFGKPLTLKAACAMASSGFVTTIKIALGESFHDLLDDAFDHFVVRLQKIVAAHARLARESRGDHDDVAVLGAVIVAAAVEMPDACASVPRIGADSAMSSALPAGTPSRIPSAPRPRGPVS